MAWLTIDDEAGSLRLEVPIQGPQAEAPYGSQVLLTLQGRRGEGPSQVVASFFPEEAEFNLRLPALLQHFPKLGDPASLSLEASQAQPVVHWAWPATSTSNLGPLPEVVGEAEAYLAKHPQLLDWARYQAVAVSFIQPVVPEPEAPKPPHLAP